MCNPLCCVLAEVGSAFVGRTDPAKERGIRIALGWRTIAVFDELPPIETVARSPPDGLRNTCFVALLVDGIVDDRRRPGLLTKLAEGAVRRGDALEAENFLPGGVNVERTEPIRAFPIPLDERVDPRGKVRRDDMREVRVTEEDLGVTLLLLDRLLGRRTLLRPNVGRFEPLLRRDTLGLR